MSKRKTMQPIRKRDEGESSRKALKIAAGVFIGIVILLSVLIIFTNN